MTSPSPGRARTRIRYIAASLASIHPAPGEPEPVCDKAALDFAWQMAEIATEQRNQAWSQIALLLTIACQDNRDAWDPYLVVDPEREQIEPAGGMLYLSIPDMPKAGLFPGHPAGTATFTIHPRDIDCFGDDMPCLTAPRSEHATIPDDAAEQAKNLLGAFLAWRYAIAERRPA